MLRIDKAILDTSGVICDNIARFGATERGLLSQNILGHIRNFVEYVAIKAFSNGADVNPNDYNLNVAALKDMQRHGNLRFLYRFHELLQKSVSHYTVDKDGSERLMLKYYEHLFKTKLYLKQAYNLDVLENIEDFPLDTDTELSDYYTKIAERIETPSRFSYAVTYNNTEIEGKLFTPKAEIEGFENIDDLIRQYNAALYYKHTGRRLEEYKGHIYIKEYAEDSAEIIKKLQQLSSSGVTQYTASVDSWLSRESYSIDDDGKKHALRQMFEKSHVALIYGSAGTGKSTLINHIANFWGEKDKLFLANTHPAVDNMRRKVGIPIFKISAIICPVGENAFTLNENALLFRRTYVR